MGVVFARPDDDDRIIAIARNGERGLTETADATTTAPADADVNPAPESREGSSPETPEESPEA